MTEADFPRILAIEGVDGAGKTSLCSAIIRQSTEYAKGLFYSSQPGGTLLAEQIRKMIKDPTTPAVCGLYLLHAARLSVLGNPAFTNGGRILLDRWIDTTYAYQGALGVPENLILELEATLPDHARADMTVFVDVPVEVAVARNKKRVAGSGEKLDAFDSADAKFFTKCKERYVERILAAPEKYIVVDGTLPTEELADLVIKKLGLF